jgi:hypothetical protein
MAYIEIYRARIDPGNVDRLLKIRSDAVAEFQRLVPELRRADLVRLDDDVWLDVLTWSAPVSEEQVAEAAEAAPVSAEMHSLMTEMLGHDRGELVHTSGVE